MPIKKITLAFIPKDSERKASFKKRKKGLIKKVSELSVLCGVEACAIIYSPFEAEPTVWPSVQGAQAVLDRFRRMSIIDQSRKMVNQESYSRYRINKAGDQLRRLQRENKLKEIARYMYMHMYGDLHDFNMADAAELGFVVNQTLKVIKARMEELKRMEKRQLTVSAPPVAPEVPMGVQEEEELEEFPWNLLESPGCEGMGWDKDGMEWPYSNLFDNNNGAGPSGTK